jgi:hypothetical protein
MAIRNFEYQGIPTSKIPIELDFTGAAIATVNGYYSINNNTVFLYVPQTVLTATASSYLTANLPQAITPSQTVSLIGSVITSSSPTTYSETQGVITVANTGILSISTNLQYNQFTSGNRCGTFSGQTLIQSILNI